MSSLSISGVGQSLFQYLQGLSGQAQPPATDPTVSTAGAVSGADPTASPDAVGAGQAQGTHHHHHGHGGGFAKIQDAVTNALQQAKSDPSADPNKVIEQAIAKAFQQNGGGAADGTNGISQPAGAVDPDGDGDTHGASQVGQGGDSVNQQFFQTLQALGVTPQQFHQDFLAAIKDTQSGQPDPSSAFANFPPGTNVDTTG